MPTVEDALAYAQAGIKIFPVHTIVDGKCTCGREKGSTCSPGKHPWVPGGAGVYAASDDIEQIREWWSIHPNANIGIACGNLNDGLYVQDIDNSPIAKKALELFASSEAPEGFVVATTGREGGGCHIYYRATVVEKDCHNLSTTDGEKIGELRGSGFYVVAPPSLHESGRNYNFVYGNLTDLSLPKYPDHKSPILGLLRTLGVNVAPLASKISEEYETAPPITAIDCPIDKTGNSVLIQLLSGNYPTRDRSSTLWRLGLELFLQAKKLGIKISREQVAGVIKQLDSQVYRKYSERRGTAADKRYWEKAVDAERDAKKGRAQQRASVGFYTFIGVNNNDVPEGLFYTGARKDIKLANFRPEILEEQEILKNGEESEAAYLVQCTLPDDSKEITITSKDIHSDRALRVAWGQLHQRTYRVEKDRFYDVWLAACELSQNVSHRKQYTATGWAETDYGWGFVIPGADGAITAEGIDDRITHYGFIQKVPQKYSLYGIDVRPAETTADYAKASEAFRELLEMLEPEMLVPMLDLVFGAPLNSVGLHSSPPLVHLYGKTGQLKTSSTLAVMSLFGRFTPKDVPDSWSSTVASIQQGLHALRDLPLLVDDYKTSHMKASDAGRLVQNYADGTARGRMAASNQDRLTALLPRALLISTGEERWEQEESVQARVLSLPFRQLEVGSTEFKERCERIRKVQDRVLQGDLGLIGGTYLRFLAQHGIDKLSNEMIQMREEERKHPDLNMRIHARKIDTIASMRVVERIIRGFIRREFPELGDLWQALRDANWEFQKDWLPKEAEESEDLGPMRQLLDAIRDGLVSGQVRLNRRRSQDFTGDLMGVVVGYYDNDAVYFTKNTTWSWYEKENARRRTDMLFSWNKVKQEARELYGDDGKSQLSEAGYIKAARISLGLARVFPDYVKTTEGMEAI